VAFADVMVREGRYPNVRPPVTPGYDLVGRVNAVGDGVDTALLGCRVGALTVTSAYAQHVVLPAEWAVPAPESLPAETAVALILNYVTAWQMLVRNTHVAQGDTVLVHGGAGGVGTALLELCRLRGVHALATASKGKHNVVEALGAEPIDYAKEDFVARAKRANGGAGVDAVFDHIGGSHLARSYEALRATGTLISYGALSAFHLGRTSPAAAIHMLLAQPKFAPLTLLGDNKAVVGFDIAGRRKARPDWFAADLGELFRLAEAGAISPLIDVVMPLELRRPLRVPRPIGELIASSRF